MCNSKLCITNLLCRTRGCIPHEKRKQTNQLCSIDIYLMMPIVQYKHQGLNKWTGNQNPHNRQKKRNKISSSLTKHYGPILDMLQLNLKYAMQEEEFEDIKGVIIIRISKKNRQHNHHKKKYKRKNTNLQNIHIKLKIE